MLNMIKTLRSQASNYALYRRTRNEIAALAPSVASDLGIMPDDAMQIARRAVWG